MFYLRKAAGVSPLKVARFRPGQRHLLHPQVVEQPCRVMQPVIRLVAGINQIYLAIPHPLRRFPYQFVVPVDAFTQPPQPFPARLKPPEYRFLLIEQLPASCNNAAVPFKDFPSVR